jgi:hypothetical protein
MGVFDFATSVASAVTTLTKAANTAVSAAVSAIQKPSAPQQPATPRWKTETAINHTKLAHSKRTRKQWAAVASDVHAKTGDRGQAVRAANHVVRETVARDLVRPIARTQSIHQRTLSRWAALRPGGRPHRVPSTRWEGHPGQHARIAQS